MDQTDVLQLLDPQMLTNVIHQAIGSHTLDITSWQLNALGRPSAGFATGGLFRIAGIGSDHGTTITWSVVLKILQAPTSELDSSQDPDLTHYAYWKREALLYQSGLLADLPEGLSAPRCYGVSESSTAIWLWLEELTDQYGEIWPLERYRLAAQHVGRLSGTYLTSRALPAAPWLSRGHDRRFVADISGAIAAIFEVFQQDSVWEHPILRRVFPVPAFDPFLRFWANHTRFLDALDRLPQTFCHYDVMRPNLFARRRMHGQDETVAIDWAHSGIAGVGVELAELVVGSLLFLHGAANDAAMLDRLAFAGYVDGLHDAGWHGDPQVARFGHLTSALVRLGVLGLWLLSHALDERNAAETEATWNRPIGDLVEHWARVVGFIFSLVDETQGLLERLEQGGSQAQR